MNRCSVCGSAIASSYEVWIDGRAAHSGCFKRKTMDSSTPPRELPQWQSHKKVWGEKITGVRAAPKKEGFWVLHLRGGFKCLVSSEWVAKHTDGNPTELVGGYYVRYADGYESWSPGEAFDKGYTLVEATV